jgi:hypothetical protein
VTNSAYGFTLQKMVCMAFVHHPDSIKGSPTVIDQRWLSDRSAKWTINIAGKMVRSSLLSLRMAHHKLHTLDPLLM